MQKITKAELVAILAAVGVASGGNLSFAANTESGNNNDPGSLGKVEHQKQVNLADDSACGKGSCGKDEKGQAAAKAKHGKGDKKDSKSAAKKKTDKK